MQKETERVLYISGEIVDGDDFDIYDGEPQKSTADIFREELYSGKGNVSVWINSPGGDMFVGAQIYNLLKNYFGQKVKTGCIPHPVFKVSWILSGLRPSRMTHEITPQRPCRLRQSRRCGRLPAHRRGLRTCR